MANEQQQTQPQVAIPLPKGKKNAVQIGCICMMLSVAMYGLVFATLTSPILESVNAMGYVSLFSIFAGMGVSIMTPIGGKLGDLIGRRNIVVIPGIIWRSMRYCICICTFLSTTYDSSSFNRIYTGCIYSSSYIIAGLINERKDVPKAMGMLATAIAVGGFGGSIIAGILTDMGLLKVAILMPAVPLILGVVLIGLNMPNVKREGKVSIDIPGIIALVVALAGILLALNFGSSIGWGNPAIIAGFVIGIVALVVLVKIEGKSAEPLIPLKLFKNSQYTVLLIVGFICYFYQSAMNVYAPIGAMKVMGAPTSAAGALQMPRTIITIFLPTIAGVWVGKKASNAWKAMVVGTLFVAVPMAVMGFTTPSTSIIIYFVALTITGIAESYRSVAITPSAQATLQPADMGVGTSLVNFVNSLANTIAATVFGVAYNLSTSADPTNVANIQNGVNSVFRLAAIVAVIGLVLVIFVVRPKMTAKKAE